MQFFFDSGTFDVMAGVMFFFTCIVFFLAFAVLVARIIRSVAQWNKNNHSPRLIVSASVVAKRSRITHHHDENDMESAHTSYYVTFEVESGDRIEFHVSGSEYGMLVEGDHGQLTFRGTRYLDFRR